MNDSDLVRLADTWLEYHCSSDSASADTEWSVLELQDLVLSNPDEAWRVVERLIARTYTTWQATLVGAGPLEDLLFLYDATYMERLEAITDRGSYFSEIISSVWIDDDATIAPRLGSLRNLDT